MERLEPLLYLSGQTIGTGGRTPLWSRRNNCVGVYCKGPSHCGNSLAFLADGETVVQLTEHGSGGRNQELALAAAEGIAGLDNVLIFSVASDGTDGSTDAVGGIVDRFTWSRLEKAGLSIHQILANNSAYHALKQVDGLIRTGPIGTNVNDVLVLLIQQAERT